MSKFLRATYLWIIAVPVLLILLGAASNQLVLIANHDTFPVMINPIKLTAWGGVNGTFGNTAMVDVVHCVMTPETHLNLLADVFDFHSTIMSIGDLLSDLGEWLWQYALIAWLVLVVKKLNNL